MITVSSSFVCHSSVILICFSEAAILTFLFFSLYFFFFPLQVAPAVSSSTEAGHSGSDTAPTLHICFLVNEGILSSFFLFVFYFQLMSFIIVTT